MKINRSTAVASGHEEERLGLINSSLIALPERVSSTVTSFPRELSADGLADRTGSRGSFPYTSTYFVQSLRRAHSRRSQFNLSATVFRLVSVFPRRPRPRGGVFAPGRKAPSIR